VRERIERVSVGFALAILVLGACAIALATPGFTRIVMVRTGGPERAGLDVSTAIRTAEGVRAYITGVAAEPLPDEVDGREGFDKRVVAHLDDVRSLFSLARVVTSLAAAILAIWLSLCLARKRSEALAAGLRSGSLFTLGLVAVASVVGSFDFASFFDGFHSLFFAAGTWTFSYDDLIIQLFAQSFWATAAASWAILALLGSAVLYVGSRLLQRPRADTAHSGHDNPVN